MVLIQVLYLLCFNISNLFKSHFKRSFLIQLVKKSSKLLKMFAWIILNILPEGFVHRASWSNSTSAFDLHLMQYLYLSSLQTPLTVALWMSLDEEC